MPKALDPHGPSVQLAPIRVPATLAARLEAFVLRPSLFPPSLAAVTRAALEAGIAVLESGALVAPTRQVPAPSPAQRTPRKRKPSDEKRAAERAAARAAREAQATPEAEG